MNITLHLTQLGYFLVLIGIMVLVHELGHFQAARAFDVKVDVFSFGFGPRLFGFRRGDTDYRFSLFLFGGYVKMAGDQPGEAGEDDPRGFLAKPRWQRLIIAFAGPFMNIVLAVVVLTGLYMVTYERVLDDQSAVIGHVMPNSPAAKAGIQAGDRIVRLNGQDNPKWEEVEYTQFGNLGHPMTVSVSRAGHVFAASVTPVIDEKTQVSGAGWVGRDEIVISSVKAGTPAASAGIRPGDIMVSVNGTPVHSRYTLPELIRKSDGKPVTLEFMRNGVLHTVFTTPVYRKLDDTGREAPRWMIGVGQEPKRHIEKTRLSLPDALAASLHENAENGTLIIKVFRGILERNVPAKNLTGPIAMAEMATEAAAQGADTFIRLLSLVSLNLAIVNLLPIPILDGAMILTLLIEMIMGRDISLNVKEAMLKVGFVFLMMLMVFVIYNDLSRHSPPGMVVYQVRKN